MHVTRSAPTTEPIALADAKAFLNVRTSDSRHDDQITRLIRGARRECERLARKAIPKQTVTIEYDTEEVRGGYLLLLPPPVISITSLKFYDESASDWSAAIAATEYLLESPSTGKLIEQEDGWLGLIERDERGLQAVYEAGWAIDDIPANVVQAVYLVLGEMFEKRVPVGGPAMLEAKRNLMTITSLRHSRI